MIYIYNKGHCEENNDEAIHTIFAKKLYLYHLKRTNTMISPDYLRKKLRNKEASIGTWAQIPSAESAYILANMGYEWVVADLEHAAFARPHLPSFFRAVKQGGALPFARLAENTRENIKAALDSGAEGLIFPMIETRAMLDAAIEQSLYPSHGGTRGVGYCAANVYGYSFDNYTQTQAHEVILIAQIEHKNALDNLDELLTHPRLDGILVGPYDLSASMGLMGQIQHSAVQDALQGICTKAHQYSVPMGLHIVKPDVALLQEKIRQGYTFLAFGMDTVFLWESAKIPFEVSK